MFSRSKVTGACRFHRVSRASFQSVDDDTLLNNDLPPELGDIRIEQWNVKISSVEVDRSRDFVKPGSIHERKKPVAHITTCV